jgi:cell division protein FtsI (penicillin-binding protein 3)
MSPIDIPRARGGFSPWTWLSQRIWTVEHAFEHAKAQRREQDTSYRIFFVLMLFATAFAMLAGGAVTKALLSGSGRGGAGGPAAVARSDLVDRNGRLLAVDLLHYGAYLDPKEAWDPAETRRILTSVFPGLPPERLDRAFKSGRRAFLAGGLSPEQKARLHDLGLPGLVFEEEERRVYPLGATASHLIGFSDTGGQGLAGAERGLDKLVRQQGAVGAPTTLSIDLRIQAALDEELKRAADTFQTIGAVGIIVDVHTGEILGLSSYPNFDPNEPGKSAAPNLVNHAAATVYEPGSVFKVFTLAMGLDAGVATPKTMFDARTPLALSGQTIHDYDKDNAMLPLWMVFTHSSNIGAARLGMLAGPERMDRYFRNFGLFAAAPSELIESARPITPRRMSDNVVASMAFGHAISVSPLAIATGMTSIVNGGTYIPLTIRKRDPDQVPKGRRVISEATSRTMLELMRLNAMKASGGTATKADAAAPGLRLGGKTGSAEKAIGGRYERKKLVSSFAAVFPTDGPIDAPRYFVLIMLDEPKPTKDTYGFATGGWTAGPTAGKVIDRIAPFLGVQRAPASAVDAYNAEIVSRYVGPQAVTKTATAATTAAAPATAEAPGEGD